MAYEFMPMNSHIITVLAGETDRAPAKHRHWAGPPWATLRGDEVDDSWSSKECVFLSAPPYETSIKNLVLSRRRETWQLVTHALLAAINIKLTVICRRRGSRMDGPCALSETYANARVLYGSR